jgi:hypothetical protein
MIVYLNMNKVLKRFKLALQLHLVGFIVRWSSKFIDLLFLMWREVSVKPFLDYL